MVATPRGDHTAHTTSSRDVPYDVHMRSNHGPVTPKADRPEAIH